MTIRRKTSPVFVGQLCIGGNFPIRVQSMLNADTKNVEKAIKQIKELIHAGCDIIRLTVPTKEDVLALANIRKTLIKENIHIPLVADIHFSPSIAMDIIPYIDKIRINPGNFVDKRTFKTKRYNASQYEEELNKIKDKFIPLIKKCQEYGVAMRIGTNHGSLSDRIMSRYGDTPEGMVASAIEFIKIAANENYHNIILSMKSSNVRVMVHAYRLLAHELDKLNLNYPFHLGVTEAGDGTDGRIKSAAGIGALLEEGIGDTIRVSLTEDPVNEIPVANLIASTYNQKFYSDQFTSKKETKTKTPVQYNRRKSNQLIIGSLTTGNNEEVRVWTHVKSIKEYTQAINKNKDGLAFEGIEITPKTKTLFNHSLSKTKIPIALISHDPHDFNNCHFISKNVFLINSEKNISSIKSTLYNNSQKHWEFCFNKATLSLKELSETVIAIKRLTQENSITNYSFSLITHNPNKDYRDLVTILDQNNLCNPVHLRYQQANTPAITDASAKIGALLLDGIGDSIQINTNHKTDFNLNLSYTLLQACRVRTSKTEFISCPTCGRTQFDMPKVLQTIKAHTSHLKGLKIGVMGCVVNGPGEMADADFGYVGMSTGKVSLYIGQTCVEKNIPQDQALDKLINLIKQQGKWINPNNKPNPQSTIHN